MAITLRRPVRVTPDVVDAPDAKTAAGHAFQWAGSRVDVESLLRLKADGRTWDEHPPVRVAA